MNETPLCPHLILYGIPQDHTREQELLFDDPVGLPFGVNARIIFRNSHPWFQGEETRYNLTEVHYWYNGSIKEDRMGWASFTGANIYRVVEDPVDTTGLIKVLSYGPSTAFESNFHRIGSTLYNRNIERIEITPATRLHETYCEAPQKEKAGIS